MPTANTPAEPIAKRYEVLVGIDYDDDTKRAEPGAVVDDLPGKSLPWLLEQNIVRPEKEA